MACNGTDRGRLVALGLAAFIAAMVGVTYASVPLYAAFCTLTGFGGSTRVAAAPPRQAAEREIAIRFDANVASGLPWTFAPDAREMVVKIGAPSLAYYRARSASGRETAGSASYNVSPPQAGAYFVKMQCFCFEAQHLGPNGAAELPVAFYVDPAILDDPDLRTLPAITLSYTFFPARTQASAGSARDKKPL
ncbi:cytochrome c oxidase assembly protein [Xanthobacter agilis]|uniref:Cytochrome c oxidase assembly protein CtaG n=1 Tax=Xanthobacter agilis TaxID=47492 RepID=A0ABU0LCI4_XANAG|nr:cytochrome c oxidase assembly protein [Xanthobacter agilis]MDQ0504859.1 cytochrome c oxidase assembly protein subunit 11 [Xanthobacter agilis]